MGDTPSQGGEKTAAEQATEVARKGFVSAVGQQDILEKTPEYRRAREFADAFNVPLAWGERARFDLAENLKEQARSMLEAGQGQQTQLDHCSGVAGSESPDVSTIAALNARLETLPLWAQYYGKEDRPLTMQAKQSLDEFLGTVERVGADEDNLDIAAMSGWNGVADPRFPPAEAAEQVARPVPDTGFNPDEGWDIKPGVNYVE